MRNTSAPRATRSFRGIRNTILVTVAAVALTLGAQTAAQAYTRGVVPVPTGFSYSASNGGVTVSWSKDYGKPDRFRFAVFYADHSSSTVTGKVPGSAGSKGYLEVATGQGDCPAGGGWTIILYNQWGASELVSRTC